MEASKTLLRGRRRIAAVVGTLLLAGCPGAAPPGPAEHHTPAHKPADYPAAVARLSELDREIVAGHARPAGELDVFTEAGDIVRWLPELAADSDLGEEPWNRIARGADELGTLIARVQAAPAAQQRDAFLALAGQWEHGLDELAAIAATAP